MYVLVLSVLLKKSFREGTSYKLMISLAIAIASCLSGYFWIVGGNYCTNSNLHFISGGVGIGLWNGSCLTCFVLALNRVLDICNRRIRDMLFEGQRIYAMMTLPFLYCNFFIFFTPPLIFNTEFMTWSFIPFTHLHDENVYFSYAHVANNVMVVMLTTLLYLVYSRVLFQRSSSSSVVLKHHMSYIIQTSAICAVNLIAGLIYGYMQLAPAPCWFPLFGHFLWIIGHGTPAVVYLCINRSIKSEVLRLLRPISISNVTTSTVGSGTIVKVTG